MMRVGDIYIVTGLEHGQISEAMVDDLCIATANKDGQKVKVRWEIEPGSAGKRISYQLARRLNGYDARGLRPKGDKLVRFKPLTQQAWHGNVWILREHWNETVLTEWHNYPDWPHDDIVDAGSGAYWELTSPTASTERIITARSPFDR
jgi:predicted phage terminase large subunit-like protein